jgi:hypothetical protein
MTTPVVYRNESDDGVEVQDDEHSAEEEDSEAINVVSRPDRRFLCSTI